VKPNDQPSLSVERLSIDVGGGASRRRVVEELSFALYPRRTLCIAGESGSGKSLSSLAIMGLLPKAASVPSGAILFDNRDLLGLPERATTARQAHRHDFPGADDLAEPAADRRPAIGGDVAPA
jgi:peptide/nickel transport system ATP-binding protein